MEPFGLPRGSVRGAIVLSLIGGTVVLGIWGNDAAFTALVGLSGVGVRDYFAHRAEANEADGPSMPPPV